MDSYESSGLLIAQIPKIIFHKELGMGIEFSTDKQDGRKKGAVLDLNGGKKGIP